MIFLFQVLVAFAGYFKLSITDVVAGLCTKKEERPCAIIINIGRSFHFLSC